MCLPERIAGPACEAVMSARIGRACLDTPRVSAEPRPIGHARGTTSWSTRLEVMNVLAPAGDFQPGCWRRRPHLDEVEVLTTAPETPLVRSWYMLDTQFRCEVMLIAAVVGPLG